VDNEDDSLECLQDIETLLDDIIYLNDSANDNLEYILERLLKMLIKLN
jgi:hypothetical protein